MSQAVKAKEDIPVPVAVALLLAVMVFLIMNQHGDSIKSLAAKLEVFAESNPMTVNMSLLAICINIALLSYVADHIWKSIRKSKSIDDFARDEVAPPKDIVPVLLRVTGWSAASGISLFIARKGLVTASGLNMLPQGLAEPFILNWAFALGTVASLAAHVSRTGRKRSRRKKSGLESLNIPENSIFIGSVPSGDPAKEEQALILTEAALGGNVLITGSIGTGKTQGTILPYFSQILDNFHPTPAVLAIDPKGSFIKEAVAIAERKGLWSKVRRLELDGSVSINPIYMPDVLKGARFVQIAHMIQAAASNFAGDHNESPFWRQSGFNLIKYSLVYTAAMKPYYTLRDLHETLRQCQNSDFSERLEKTLEQPWDAEVRENISYALSYFSGEFSTFDEKVRSGIVATATAFLHQFQEYQAAQLFCPTEENCTIRSMDEVVDEGLLLFFDVRNEGLARSMGTLIKLLYQQSVLNRIANDSRPSERMALLIIDEYQDVATTGAGKSLGDERFLAKAREGRALTIVATQSISSLETSLGSGASVKELRQNFRTLICLQSTDTTTINVLQKLVGEEEKERISRSYSEQTREGGEALSTKPASRSESITKSVQKESVVTGLDFSSLGKFEAIALIYDGHTTQFVKRLLLKPYFLGERRLAHSELTVMLRKGIQAMSLVVAAMLASPANSFPNICDVVAAPEFNACLDYHVGECVCPLPQPHPCASFSYYVPRTFVEVTDESVETAFRGLPGVTAQLPTTAASVAPFGTEGDDFAAFQARTLAVPFSDAILQGLPCRGGIGESVCFGAMSEHLGPLWTSGVADRFQPNYLAWLASPKACLMAGLAKSAVGGSSSLPGAGSPACSLPVARLPAFPPSTHEACNGWGLFYPRVGIYDGPEPNNSRFDGGIAHEESLLRGLLIGSVFH